MLYKDIFMYSRMIMAVPDKVISKTTSTLYQGGAEDFDIFCEQCDRDDIRLPAFGYIEDCAALMSNLL
jgi:hypothetical protein